MTLFIILHLYISISLHFIAKVTYLLFLFVVVVVVVVVFFFFFLGHTASFCGRGVGEECPWRD